MLEISCVVNIDSRKENLQNQEMFRGVTCSDFWIEGLENKRRLFKDFSFELICFLDEHEPIDEKTLFHMKQICDTLVIRKHNKNFEDIEDFSAFNDFNYIQALTQARGKYIFHFDGDVAAFTQSPEPIKEYIALLEKYDFVSYPSHWSPNPVDDGSFQNIFWVSTRFFCCKRNTLDFTEIIKCQLDYDYWKEKYPRARLCHWLEHLLHNGKENCVYYPPIDYEKVIIFVWENYQKGLLSKMNNQPFDMIKQFVFNCGGIHYPNNLTVPVN